MNNDSAEQLDSIVCPIDLDCLGVRGPWDQHRLRQSASISKSIIADSCTVLRDIEIDPALEESQVTWRGNSDHDNNTVGCSPRTAGNVELQISNPTCSTSDTLQEMQESVTGHGIQSNCSKVTFVETARGEYGVRLARVDVDGGKVREGSCREEDNPTPGNFAAPVHTKRCKIRKVLGSFASIRRHSLTLSAVAGRDLRNRKLLELTGEHYQIRRVFFSFFHLLGYFDPLYFFKDNYYK